MSLTLKHYSSTPAMRLDRSRDYTEHRRLDKPSGFWVSVEGPDDWPTWCTAENFATGALANEHTVTLAPDARILTVDNLTDLYALTARFPRGDRWSEHYPDWARIAAEYDGIIIAPYQWAARFDLTWYYPWDCASGCIWSLDAIAAVEPVRQAVAS